MTGQAAATRLPPSVAKRFRSGRPCLDFGHTAAADEWVEPELIVDARSLERWLAHILGHPHVLVRDGDVPTAHRLRAAILRLARARANDVNLSAADVRTVNEFAAPAPPAPQLLVDGTASVSAETSVAAALSAIARDAVDLLTGPLGHRIRVCAADDCAFLFVDASRPGSRRWCSMQRCGNLSKVRTHRRSQAKGSPTTGGVQGLE